MPLLHHPGPPHSDGFYVPFQYLRVHTEWQKYLSQ
jgi:hypothetical protein